MDVRIALDPGLQGTGLAIWPDATWGEVLSPSEVVVFNPVRGLTWEAQGQNHALRLQKHLGRRRVVRAYCEVPVFYASSAGGHMAAATGDLVKLSFAVGCLAGAIPLGRFEGVKVPEWKGQLSKPIVELRIRKILGDICCQHLNIKTHAWDAVGIGLWAMGKF